MKRHTGLGAGSLDMLLDTMCNTFGGVCFIALLVAILSAMLPKETTPQEDAETDVARLVEDERLAQLQRRRDELKNAVRLQAELLETATNATDVITVTEAEFVSNLAKKDDAVRDLRAKLRAMEEEIARLATAADYNKTEAERLKKLAEELRKQIEKAETARRRTVRTPLERDQPGVRPVNLWIRNGCLFDMEDESQCRCRTEGYGESLQWHYTIIPGAGTRVTEGYLRGGDFASLSRRLGGMNYARIYVDSSSFSELCLLRDELVRRGFRYNWYLHDRDMIDFVVFRRAS